MNEQALYFLEKITINPYQNSNYDAISNRFNKFLFKPMVIIKNKFLLQIQIVL